MPNMNPIFDGTSWRINGTRINLVEEGTTITDHRTGEKETVQALGFVMSRDRSEAFCTQRAYDLLVEEIKDRQRQEALRE